MRGSDEYRQPLIAVELEQAARLLADSTHRITNPHDSYQLIDELEATVGHLAEVCEQYATWHGDAAHGTHYHGETDAGATRAAAAELRTAAEGLVSVAASLGRAKERNRAVRWHDIEADHPSATTAD